MARIVRHNDETVREGYIRNGGKEVKLFTSALKAFQRNIRIVMAQRKHLKHFLRGKTIGRLECGRTQLEVSEELGITHSVISRLWQRFQDDGNVSRCYSTGHPRVTTPNEDRYLAVTAKRNRRSTASDLPRQLSSATGTNPIEHVWDMLGRRIAARQPPPTCLPELRRALLDEWCNIPQDQIDNLILSMPRRCKACIASSGRHTPY
ncbi:uncharacterized protein TNCV_3849131 [Trichonephila clavipes]|uniref:Uncharacterized protein n=1 Tax=Trichonephila clavipes TaxID=2585209 RepID=A0A8X6R8F0_TRICX|nr:uncharacterized protein TNCV_3849131 [Trichonephila clavipes]